MPVPAPRFRALGLGFRKSRTTRRTPPPRPFRGAFETLETRLLLSNGILAAASPPLTVPLTGRIVEQNDQVLPAHTDQFYRYTAVQNGVVTAELFLTGT